MKVYSELLATARERPRTEFGGIIEMQDIRQTENGPCERKVPIGQPRIFG
ncbi:hypothetical protein [Novosphingobium resinovorum]|nr:hypothetical protein [Novosphingobium resinovorum]